MEEHTIVHRRSGTHAAFPALLRAFATLAIVIHHSWITAVNLRHAHGPQIFADLGQVAVACFFALSGFLLARPYIVALLATTPMPSWQTFARDRFLRIFPLYAACTLAFAAFPRVFPVPGEAIAGPLDVILHLTFTFTAFPATTLTVDPVMWTMATDLQFYIALPVLFAIIAAIVRRTGRPPLKVTFIVVAFACAASLAWRLCNAGRVDEAIASFALRVERFDQLPGMFWTFGCGIMAALATLATPVRHQIRLGWSALAIAAIATTLATGLPIDRFNDVVLDEVLWGSAAAGAIVSGCIFVPTLGAAMPVVRMAEALSYAIYLVHFFVLQYVAIPLMTLDPGRFFVALAVLGYGVSAVVAIPLYVGIERPFLVLKTRLKLAARPPAATTSQTVLPSRT